MIYETIYVMNSPSFASFQGTQRCLSALLMAISIMVSISCLSELPTITCLRQLCVCDNHVFATIMSF